jgi:hypothetical protein
VPEWRNLVERGRLPLDDPSSPLPALRATRRVSTAMRFPILPFAVRLGPLLSVLVLALAACESTNAAPSGWGDVCIDADGDGFGAECAAGTDCDDGDPSVHADCAACAPADKAGCACVVEGASAACVDGRSIGEDGALLCAVGTRTCRGARWSACEHIVETQRPAQHARLFQALLDPDAAPVGCDPCHPDCYRVTDPLGPADAGLGTNIASNAGGGVTLTAQVSDSGTDAGSGDGGQAACVPGTAPDRDCDGIPDTFDPYPNAPPFATNNSTIFLDLAAGQAKNHDLGLTFRVNSADVYFYLDMTASMEGERDNLIANLTTGNFLPDAGVGMNCADRDFNGTPDNDLKTKGIAGNIACLIRDAQLGAGWFRDIPFYGPYANGIAVAPVDFAPFEHRQDVTGNVESVRTALSGFVTSGNYNIPEGGMQGLWSLVTGQELYVGWDRPGIPARVGCPAGTWGYPCFRTGAVPIVVQITDAPMQNGPNPTTASRSNYLSDCTDVCTQYSCSCSTAYRNPLNYDANVLAGMKSGTDPHYRALTATAETKTTAQSMGTIGSAFVTYAGTTENMASDLTYATTGTCPSGSAWLSSSATSPDAVFTFTLASTKTLTISTRGSRFDTTLMVTQSNGSVVTCNDDLGQGDLRSEIVRSFAAGTYYVFLKGYSATAKGRFQLSVGDATLQTTSAFGAKTWLGPTGNGVGGVREPLLQQQVHVIGVNGSTDAYLAEQAQTIATTTGATSSTGAALTFNITSNGTGLGSGLIDAINRLSGNLAMDVSTRLVESPDSPAPRHFGLTVQAIDMPGDSCGTSIDTDGDPAHLPDTHVRCTPGASPRFRITVSNPAAPANIPPNPSDPNGGYNMRMELIGNNQYVIDSIPVYIIPEAVVPAPATPLFAATGSYEQSTEAKGCSGTDLPIWTSLSWDDTLPDGTNIVFDVCTADTASDLAHCTLHTAATVTSGAACISNSQCAGGYCSSNGHCEYVRGPSCRNTADCGSGGQCTGSVCTWGQNPIDLKPALSVGEQGRALLRTRVTLNASTDRTLAPSVSTWGVKYTCTPQQ